MSRRSPTFLELYGYDSLLGSIAAFYVIMAPYTKVEESFNVQAMHDILHHQHHLENYDHLEFPGVVPRTFLGALVTSIMASPMVFVINLLRMPKIYSLVAVRLVLGSFLLSTLRYFRVQFATMAIVLPLLLEELLIKFYKLLKIKKKFGHQVEAFFVILLASQFHTLFYCTRPLPNILALGLVNLAYGFWLQGSLYAALRCLIFATIVFRCDMLLLLCPLGLELLLTKSISIQGAFKCCTVAVLFSIGLTVAVDSIMWRRLSWPEFEVFWFNSVLNRSSEWGTHPFHWYFTSALPRSLLAAYPLFMIGALLDRRVLFYTLPVFSFVLLYSKLPHKELRFIISSIPMFNLSAAVAASRIYNNRRKGFWNLLYVALLGLLVISLGGTVITFMASFENYPSGYALKALHRTGHSENTTEEMLVHIDTFSAMNGISRFCENDFPWRYSKEEGIYPEEFHRRNFTYLLNEHSSIKGFKCLFAVNGFSRFRLRVDFPPIYLIVTREAIHYGRAESGIKTSLVKWALPYAQRYVYNVYPYKYAEIKQSGFQSLDRLEIIVVNKLLYRNVIKRTEIASANQYECNCLLQGDILYTSQKSDSHSIFVELSRFLIDAVPELHMANFLHMIRTMTELGSTTDQTEFFILNSQKVPKLPDEEPIWTLQSTKDDENLTTSSVSTKTVDPNTSKHKGKTESNLFWRPINPRNTSKLSSANKVKIKVSASQQMQRTDNVNQSVVRTDPNVFMKSNTDWTLGKNANSSSHMVISQNPVISGNEAHHGSIMGCSGMNIEHNHHLPSTSSPYPSNPPLAFGLGKYSHIDSVEIVTPSDDLISSSCNLKERDQLSYGTSPGQQALLTGRLGEIEAFKYFRNSAGEKYVRWVNKTNETGLPYDILVGDGKGQEYIEVKTTDSTGKDWFTISIREWQFAVEKGDLFSIARVVLLGNNMVRITILKNPARLCLQGQLQLALLMLN